MRPMFISAGVGGVPHRLYDMSIEDMEERKRKSLLFHTASDLADYLGIDPSKVSQIRRPGRYAYSEKHGGKRFAIRIEEKHRA